MTAYIVMALPDDSPDAFDLPGAVLVKQGFSPLAAVLPIVWFLWNGMIITLLIVASFYAVVLGAISLAASPLVIGPISLMLSIWFGFESANLRRAILALRNYQEIGVAEGNGREDAAERFFLHWENAAARQSSSKALARVRNDDQSPTSTITSVPVTGAVRT